MSSDGDSAADNGVLIGLSAVVMALRGRQLVALTTQSGTEPLGLPFGPFDPKRDRTFELALRAFVAAQTGFHPGFVEQLYTFGDAGRDSPRAAPMPDRQRVVSVGYLALTPDGADVPSADARWTPLAEVFPWEDRRAGCPEIINTVIAPALARWASQAEVERRRARTDGLFALSPGRRWNEERVLERYELLYEAGLVAEAARDRGRSVDPVAPGRPMASDHRRILATALGRLRSKMKYRPVLFDLTPATFTLSRLQAAAEAVSGLTLHKQNFRRGVERAGLVEATGRLSTGTGGRPAELYRFVGADPLGGQSLGLSLPAQR